MKTTSKLRLSINRKGKIEADFPLKKRASSVIREVLSHEGITRPMEVSLYLTDAEEVARLNAEFRHLQKTTDVLSFPSADADSPVAFKTIIEDLPDTEFFFLGDIILNWEKVLSQAYEYGHSVEREYSFLIAHSCLHLMGYDHQTKKEEKEMIRIQEEVLSSLHLERE